MSPLALALVLSATPPAWIGDFETGNTSQWNGRAQAMAPDRLQVVERAIQGRYALQATVKPGDLHSNGARAEVLLDRPRFCEGDESWFRWSTKFPEDFRTSPRWHIWTQWHQEADNGGSPPLEFALQGEELHLRVQGRQYDARGDWTGGIVWRAPLQRGVWHEYLLHVKWSTRPEAGFLELWVDGRLELARIYHGTLDVDGVVYLKQGLYRDRTITWDQTVYHDGMALYTNDPRPLPADAGAVELDVGVEPPAQPEPVDPSASPQVIDSPAPDQASRRRGCGGPVTFALLLVAALLPGRYRFLGR